MYISKLLQIVALGACALAPAMSVIAADAPAPAPPPKLEKLEEGEEPTITIGAPTTERKITEKRGSGQDTEVTVQSGKSSYVMKGKAPAGFALRGDAASNANRPALWKVLEFDSGNKKAKDDESGAASAEAPPPPKLEPQAQTPPPKM